MYNYARSHHFHTPNISSRTVLLTAMAVLGVLGAALAAQSKTSDLPLNTSEGSAGVSQSTAAPYTFGAKQGGNEDVMVLNNVNVADHGTFERITLQFQGQKEAGQTGIPKWSATQASGAYQDLDGNTVQLSEKNYIELVVNANEADLTTAAPDVVYTGPQTFAPQMDTLKEAKFVPAYENNSMIMVVGLGDKAAFRVTELTDPSRIVLDVKK